MKIGEFFVSLGVNADTKVLSEFGEKVKTTLQKVVGLKTALFASAAAFAYFSHETYQSTIELENFGRATDLSIDRLQKFQKAAQLSGTGLDAGAVANQIAAFQKNLTNLKFGDGDTAGFRLMGINPLGKDAFQIIEEMRGALKGLSNADATNLVEKVGLSPEFLKLLRMTREEMEAMGSGNFLSSSRREDVMKMGNEMTALSKSVKELKDQFVAALAPIVTIFLKGVVYLADAVGWLAKKFNDMEGSTRLLTSGFVALGVVMFTSLIPALFGVATAAAAALLPLLPYIALIAALALIIEDLWVAFQGGDSVSGDIFNWGKEKLQEFSKWLEEIWEWIGKIGSEFETWASEGLEKLLNTFVEWAKILDEIWESITNITASQLWDLLKSGASKVGNLIMGEGEKGASNISNIGGNKTASITNTYNINTTASAQDLRKELDQRDNANLNMAFSEVGYV